MKTEVKLRPEMGPEIIKHLRQFGDIPARGFLAGQAVDSAITDLFGKGGGVYNDLDIFRTIPRHSKWAKQTRGQDKHVIHMSGRSKVFMAASSYEQMASVMSLLGTYNLESVSRVGMLNYVNCSPAGRASTVRDLTPERILSGFDLNCVRVGVNLATNTLHWDGHYEEFLASRQLKISMMHTPWHTFVRLCKKLEELPDVYTNIETAAIACTALSKSYSIMHMRNGGDVSLKCGAKYHELMQKYKSYMAPYFEISSEEFVDKFAEGDRSEKKVTLYECKPRADVSSDTQLKVNALGLGALFFSYRTVEQTMQKHSVQNLAKFESIKAHQDQSNLSVAQNFVSTQLKWFGPAYVKGQALADVSDKVNEFLKKHQSLAGALVGLTLAQQWEAIQRLRKIANTMGKKHWDGDIQAPYGVMEELVDSNSILHEEIITRLVEERAQYDMAPFNMVPLSMPKFPAHLGVTAQELLSPEALRKEGKDMEHCVGGYSGAVRMGRSRIIQIRTGPNRRTQWSTAELIRDDRSGTPGGWTVAQHRAPKNKTPEPANEKVLGMVMANLDACALASGRVPLRVLAWKAKLQELGYRLVAAGVAFADVKLNRVIKWVLRAKRDISQSHLKARKHRENFEVMQQVLSAASMQSLSTTLQYAIATPSTAWAGNVDDDYDDDTF